MTMSTEIRKILYATDLGSHMRPVFRYAVTLAEKCGAKISMLHVSDVFSPDVHWALQTYMPDADARQIEQQWMKELQDRMRVRLADFCRAELGKSPEESNLVTDVRAIAGRPADTIVRMADEWNVDLIVVGSHTDTSIGAGLLGSTARKVTRLSKKPVLVVPVSA
jgi:nucleotide-binding universal stress UspA family protein